MCGEGPGDTEDRTGRPFDGRAGQELDWTYLRLAGLERDEVFITNTVQCRQERNGVDVRPGKELAKVCADNHLWGELYAVDPEIVILCGAAACEAFDKTIDLELEHGFPRQMEIGFWSGTVVPMYHPAAGMHESRFMIPLLEDWRRLGEWMRGEWMPPGGCDGREDEQDYRLIDSSEELGRDFKRWGAPYRVACDTEDNEGSVYSVQYSLRPGHGRFIHAERRDVVRALCDAAGGRFIFHNAPHDIRAVEEAGGFVTDFTDTMQELYHLGNLPQGLKAAVYRTLGYRMTSYDEVVTPYSKSELETWLAVALAHLSDNRLVEPHPPGKTCPACGKNHRLDMSKSIPHPAEAVIRRVMGKLTDGSKYDPWQQPKYERDGMYKPRLIGRDWLEPVEQTVGRMPRRSIIHAPIEKQIMYACGDADWTGRLASWLEGERARIVREEWCIGERRRAA